MTTLGAVGVDGTIYNAANITIGYIANQHEKPSTKGTRHWYELWLVAHSLLMMQDAAGNHVAVGTITETGRFKTRPNEITPSARVGAFALLYMPLTERNEEENRPNTKAAWHDVALLSAMLYTPLFFLIYAVGINPIQVSVLGVRLGFTTGTFLCFFLVWWIVRQIKIEQSFKSHNFNYRLQLLNRNTGLQKMNRAILWCLDLAILLAAYTGSYYFIPLMAALAIGVRGNKRYCSHEPWRMDLYRAGGDGEARMPDPDDENPDPERYHDELYQWTLDSTTHQLQAQLSLRLDMQAIETLRQQNPFRANSLPHIKAVEKLFKGYTDRHLVHKIVAYVNYESQHIGLTQLEQLQLLLDFAQEPNIVYAYDEDCAEIGHPTDYARYPDETICDRRGDCDCKAVLAASLFVEAGFKTAYVITQNHAAVGVAFKDADTSLMTARCSNAILSKDGLPYFFCETTGDGFRIGDMASTRKEDIADVLFLN